MNKEKWQKIVQEECSKRGELPINDPNNWNKDRKVLLDFVKSVDEATEVYFLENAENEK